MFITSPMIGFGKRNLSKHKWIKISNLQMDTLSFATTSLRMHNTQLELSRIQIRSVALLELWRPFTEDNCTQRSTKRTNYDTFSCTGTYHVGR